MTAQHRLAIVTQGFEGGGGVATVVRWVRESLEATGQWAVDIHDLADSRRDAASRRLLAPRSWRRSSLAVPPIDVGGIWHWGAIAVEVEAMRYQPRRELTVALQQYDIVQVVAGAPALALATLRANVPVALQVATMAALERRAQLRGRYEAKSLWRMAMTRVTSRIEVVALRGVDVVLVENDVMLGQCREHGQRQAIKAPPGVDTDRFTPAQPIRRVDGHLLAVARLTDPRKGLERLIEAYAALCRRSNTPRALVVAGRGPVPDALRQQIADLGVEAHVRLMVDVDEVELLELYRQASVFVQTSYEEGLGIAVLEAMACGLPVVATRTAGTIETVHDGRTGWLVPQTADADDIADAASVALGPAGTAAGAEGRERCVRLFSRAATLKPYLDIYQGLLAASARRG